MVFMARDTLHNSSRRLIARFGRSAALAFLPIAVAMGRKIRLASHPDPYDTRSRCVMQSIPRNTLHNSSRHLLLIARPVRFAALAFAAYS
jgi:hypothetical protein